jgi:hypothetical protein
MANDVNIKGQISIDTGDSSQQIGNVKKGLNDVSASAKDSHSNFSNLKESLGKLSPGLKESSEGVEGLNTSFKALLANPIVLAIAAVVAVLAGLYKAFTSTIAGAQKMEQIFTGMKTALTVLTDRLVTFGNSIIKLFSGDFQGAANDAKAAFTGIGKEISDTYSKAAAIQKRLQEIRAEERKDAKDQAARKARLVELKEMLADEDINTKEKKKMAAELKELATKDGQEDLKRTKEKNDLEIQLIKVKTNLTEQDLDEINKLEIENDAKLNEVKAEGVKINRLNKTLDKQISAQAQADLADEKRKHDELIKSLEEEQKLRTKIWVSMKEDGVITVQEYRDAEQKIEDDKKAKLKKAENERLSNQREFLDKQRNLLAVDLADNQAASLAKTQIYETEVRAKEELRGLEISGLNALADLVGRNTLVGKSLAIASATISTWFSANKAYASQMAILTPDAPFRAALAAGIAVTTGLAQIKNIASVQIPGQGAGSPGSSISVSSPITPSIPRVQSTTRLDQQSINGITNAAQGGTTRAFVLEQDIRDNQERVARITRAARLG